MGFNDDEVKYIVRFDSFINILVFIFTSFSTPLPFYGIKSWTVLHYSKDIMFITLSYVSIALLPSVVFNVVVLFFFCCF